MRPSLPFALILLAAACSGRRDFPPGPEDAGEDSKLPDAEDVLPDTLVPDTAPPPDTLLPDSRPPPDTLPPMDTAVRDTAAPDTSLPDTALPDSSLEDTAAPDTAVPDAGDTGAPGDAGTRCRRDMDCAGMAGRTLCDLLSGRCVGCLATADSCPRGSYCDGAMGACAPGCRSALDCMATPMTPFCDVASHQCGECMTDTNCAIGRVCRDRRCVAGCGPGRSCPAGETCCGTACLNTASDPTHCGSCTTVCPSMRGRATCAAGVCALTCEAPYGNCDGSVLNGCETDLDTSLTHCGACGRACNPPNAIGLCSSGACAILACSGGFRDCDMSAANGCEANFNSDRNNCGRCGGVCPAGRSCVGGACTTLVTGYTVAPIPTAFLDACSAPARRVVSLGSGFPYQYETGIPIPFPFRFWNLTYSELVVSASGYIQFGASPFGLGLNGRYSLPNMSAPRPAVFVGGRSLYTRGFSVCTATFGAAPSRQFVVYWSSVGTTSSSSPPGVMSMELILNEGTQTLDFVYRSISGSGVTGPESIVGLQDETGTMAAVYPTTSFGSLSNGLAIRFSPFP